MSTGAKVNNVIHRHKETQFRAETWFAANRLLLNKVKTVEMLFSLKEHDFDNDFDSTTKFLGLYIDDHLQRNWHEEMTAKTICKNFTQQQSSYRFHQKCLLCSLSESFYLWPNSLGSFSNKI